MTFAGVIDIYGLFFMYVIPIEIHWNFLLFWNHVRLDKRRICNAWGI